MCQRDAPSAVPTGYLALQQNAVFHEGQRRSSQHIIVTTKERNSMGILIWLVVGGLVGWVASLIMKTDGSQGIILNVVVGIVGALIAGYFISPLVGVASINQNALNIGSILVSLVGAIILIGIVKLVRGGVR